MSEKSFETFLQDYHAKTHPTILDDDLSDAFDDWLADLDMNDFIELAEKWIIADRRRILSEVERPLIYYKKINYDVNQEALEEAIDEALSVIGKYKEGK